MDAAVTRIFPIHERLALNIRLEAFNVFNHPNFTPGGTVSTAITTAFNSSTFGYATAAQPARIFQLAGKFTFYPSLLHHHQNGCPMPGSHF